jgi:hypothetical protein
MDDELFFMRLAALTDGSAALSERAPTRLRARLYSALVAEMAANASLRPLPVTKASGRALCVFENLLQIIPNTHITSMNPCRVCHARLLAEHFESPPIYWPHCPYVAFRDD